MNLPFRNKNSSYAAAVAAASDDDDEEDEEDEEEEEEEEEKEEEVEATTMTGNGRWTRCGPGCRASRFVNSIAQNIQELICSAANLDAMQISKRDHYARGVFKRLLGVPGMSLIDGSFMRAAQYPARVTTVRVLEGLSLLFFPSPSLSQSLSQCLSLSLSLCLWLYVMYIDIDEYAACIHHVLMHSQGATIRARLLSLGA